MSRSVLLFSACFVVLLALDVPAAGQAAVEAGLGAGASSIGAAGTQGIGKSIGGVFRNLDETLRPQGNAGARPSDPPKASAPAKAAARRRSVGKTAVARGKTTPAVKPPTPGYEDAMQIQKGIGYEELLRRFGPPAMQIASGNDAKTITYVGHSGVVQLELRGGTVISVTTMKSGA